MGLDMYLTGKLYIGGQYKHNKIKGTIEINDEANETIISIPITKVSEIELAIGYWRKANMIHNWFVENIQNGNDDCNPYYVNFDQLDNLKQLCQDIIDKKKSPEFLPPTSGFFFGSTDIDEYYYQDLEDTVAIIDNALKEYKTYPNLSFYYQSSW